MFLFLFPDVGHGLQFWCASNKCWVPFSWCPFDVRAAGSIVLVSVLFRNRPRIYRYFYQFPWYMYLSCFSSISCRINRIHRIHRISTRGFWIEVHTAVYTPSITEDTMRIAHYYWYVLHFLRARTDSDSVVISDCSTTISNAQYHSLIGNVLIEESLVPDSRLYIFG